LKSLLLSQLGCHFWPGLAARSAYIEIIGFFDLGSFCHFAVPPFSGQPSCLISLGRLGRGPKPSIEIIDVSSFVLFAGCPPVSAGVKAAEALL